MQLKLISINILDQLISVSEQLSDDEFRKPLETLSQNTIGKHIRHIIEFYDIMIIGNQTGEINYDQRSHDKVIEENRLLAVEKMNSLKIELEAIKEDRLLTLSANYDLRKDKSEEMRTSFFRELQYNIEHAIHHMAIIKIACLQAHPQLNLPENFGVAYSTIRYQSEN